MADESIMKSNIKERPPVYVDGKLRLFKISDDGNLYAQDKLIDTKIELWFEELSVSDKLRIVMNEADLDITSKIRIPQDRNIDARCVVKINDEFHHVYNAYHFRNKAGYLQTDLTLERYEYDENEIN